MTNCPNCGAPYKLNSRVCEYCGTVREQAKVSHDDAILIDVGSSFRDLGGAIEPYIRQKWAYISGAMPDQSQQAACGVQALANAASHNIATCSFEQMRLNAMQAQVNVAQREQTFRLMCNAFPHVEPPPEMEPKKRFAPAMPLPFSVNAFLLLLLTAFTVIAGVLCALYGASFFQKARLIGLISVGYTIGLRTLIRAYRGSVK